ncbi:unnamed protein product [Trichobilharzia szidati]|nr:unnamed protein product [Trichobilharzia szidati]
MHAKEALCDSRIRMLLFTQFNFSGKVLTDNQNSTTASPVLKNTPHANQMKISHGSEEIKDYIQKSKEGKLSSQNTNILFPDNNETQLLAFHTSNGAFLWLN